MIIVIYINFVFYIAMLCAKINQKCMGFTNQIMAVVWAIIKTIRNPNSCVAVIDHFLIDHLKSEYAPISQIINIDELNEYLLQKYNAIVVDKYYTTWKLLNARYGDNTKQIDITD
jgi:hypothetical protein